MTRTTRETVNRAAHALARTLGYGVAVVHGGSSTVGESWHVMFYRDPASPSLGAPPAETVRGGLTARETVAVLDAMRLGALAARAAETYDGTSDLDRLAVYGRTLVAAGFDVWLTPTGYRHGGYLTYRDRATGYVGTFQHSDHDGWSHSMPLVPSREHGSSMWLDGAPDDPWTVDAARHTAREYGYNPLVGRQRNVAAVTEPGKPGGRGAYIGDNAVALH